MAALRAFIGGLLGLILGAVGTALVSAEVMGWFGVSDFEGGRGMAAAFFWGPLGGIVGLGLGIWLGLRWGRRKTVAADGKAAPMHGFRNTLIALGGIVALGAAILAFQYYATPQVLEYDGARADLVYELRVPEAQAALLDPAAIEMSLDTDLNQMPGNWTDAAPRREGGFAMLAGEVELYYRTSSRLLVFRLPGGRDLIFQPGLPAKPDAGTGWSDWRKVDFVGEPGATQTHAPGPDEPFELRHRVRLWGME